MPFMVEKERGSRLSSLSRRDLLFMGSGAGLGATIAGTVEQRMYNEDHERAITRAHFNTFRGLVDKYTNLGAYYPGGFESLTDTDLESLFVKRVFRDPEAGRTRRLYQLALPHTPADSLDDLLYPAIEVRAQTNEKSTKGSSQIDVLRIHGHFVPETSQGKAELRLVNYNPARHMDEGKFTLPQMKELISPMFVDSGFTEQEWDETWGASYRNPEKTAYMLSLYHADKAKIAGVSLEKNGEFTYYQSRLK